jgi:two-component system OmpR family response regulator
MVLVAHLRALIRRGAPERPTNITDGSLVLDPSKKCVNRGDTELKLTAREYGLLFYLMRHAGDVLTKAQILDNVWDSAFEGGDNVIEVYIGYLRKKIDAPFGLQTLITLRGLGYRLDSDQPTSDQTDADVSSPQRT